MIRRVLPVLFVLSAFVSTSCSFTRDDTDIAYLIGVAQANLSEPWREVMNSEILQAAEQYPGLRIVFTNAGDNPMKQEADIQDLIGLGVDLLIVSPVESRELSEVIRQAYETTPVIVLDKAVEGYDYSLFIGVDNDLVGRQAARFVLDSVGDGPARVIEITGGADSLPVRERSRGFRDELAQNENIQLMAGFSAHWLRDQAQDLTAANLDLFAEASVIFAHNDAMAQGVRRALDAGGLEDQILIGIDGLTGEDGGLALVEQGLLDATIICPTGGTEAVNRAMDILLERDGLPKKIFLRSSLVTSELLASGESAVPRRGHPADGDIVLGFSQGGSESSWREANTASIIQAAEDAGIILDFRNAELSQENQIAAIRDFIAQAVDVIAFSPIVATGWDAVLQEAKDAGIPVIASDRTVEVADETLITTYIVADFLEEGRRAADWLLEETRGRSDVTVVEIGGLEGSTPAIDRRTGFFQTLSRSSHHRIIDSGNGDFIENLGYEVMTGFLPRHPRIDAVYAHNDDMALGAIRAIEEAGLNPGTDILIVSIDGVKEAFQAMVRGKLNCTVECSPLLGPQLMKLVSNYVRGEDLPLLINTEEGVFPQDVARDYLRSRPY